MSRFTRIRIAIVLTALVAGASVGALASIAFAKSANTLQTAHNSKLGETLVVSSGGLTLYALRPETAHHLLCKTSTCFGIWSPLKVSKNAKLTAAHGIKGTLGKLHRDGFYQVTLGGDPLYTFNGDGGKHGQATGNGIKSFGGTRHVIATSSAKSTNTTTTTTSTTTTSTYSYPGY